MSSKRVAIAGASGNLGVPVLHALLEADYDVTVLTREGGNSSRFGQHRNLTIEEVNFESVQELTQALLGVEVVVCCFATLAIGSQNTLIDAAVAAGVKRYMPAEFGMDSANPLCVQLPVCAPKAATQEYLQSKVKLNNSFSWTAIANGLFLDWGMQVGFIIDPAKHTASLYNGGNIRFSATLLNDIAKTILGVIRNQGETANRVVYIHSTVTTQNELIRYASECDGKTWSTENVETEDVRREIIAHLERGENEAAMLGSSVVGMWGSAYGGDFSDRLDNELLEINTLADSDLRKLVGSYLK